MMMRESTETGMDILITQFWVNSVCRNSSKRRWGKKKLRVIKVLERLASSRENTKISFKLRLEHCSEVDCATADEVIQFIT